MSPPYLLANPSLMGVGPIFRSTATVVAASYQSLLVCVHGKGQTPCHLDLSGIQFAFDWTAHLCSSKSVERMVIHLEVFGSFPSLGMTTMLKESTWHWVHA